MAFGPVSRPKSAVLDVRRGRDVVAVLSAVAVSLLLLFAVFLDQGQLLAPLLGERAGALNYIHELVHDARHLLGAPCH